MSREPRFLLGFGEKLTKPTDPPGGGSPTEAPYGFDEAVARLSRQFDATLNAIHQLPDKACPDGEAVINVTLHPQALAKSYHPKRLFDQYNLRQVGSKPTEIKPERWTKKPEPVLSPATTLFVAGGIKDFELFQSDLSNSPERFPGDYLQRIELIQAPRIEDRIRNPESAVEKEGFRYYEALLHARPVNDDGIIIEAFSQFAQDMGVEALIDKRIFAGGLCFIPLLCSERALDDLAEFAFVRSVRPASRLRSLGPGGGLRTKGNLNVSDSALSLRSGTDVNVAILDGGVTPDELLSPWVSVITPDGVGKAQQSLVSHGSDVVSAFLFGNIDPSESLDAPPAKVDSWRILDVESEKDPFEMYTALEYVSKALHSKKYQFINLSIGPAMCIDDEDVHPWTAVIDEALADGQTLLTVAAGNNGNQSDDRVQVPSDCINALTVGAASAPQNPWSRALYSAIGPGRSPGLIKPDILAFGGSHSNPFYVPELPSANQMVKLQQGTSFAAPLALRQAVALRQHFGDQLQPLVIKALLIHSSTPGGSIHEEGWGLMNHDIADIVTCDENEVRVVYQGTLEPSKYLRAGIPVPHGLVAGKVEISATFCYASEVDPEDPGNYSRAGLEVFFRPNSEDFKRDDSLHPKTAEFFQKKDYSTEAELRNDAHKWETVLHKSKVKMATSLKDPVFDIHYNARSNGGSPKSPRPIPYSLVVSVKTLKPSDLYDKVLNQFGTVLQPLRPVLQLPIQ